MVSSFRDDSDAAVDSDGFVLEMAGHAAVWFLVIVCFWFALPDGSSWSKRLCAVPVDCGEHCSRRGDDAWLHQLAFNRLPK